MFEGIELKICQVEQADQMFDAVIDDAPPLRRVDVDDKPETDRPQSRLLWSHHNINGSASSKDRHQ